MFKPVLHGLDLHIQMLLAVIFYYSFRNSCLLYSIFKTHSDFSKIPVSLMNALNSQQ